MKNTLFLCPVCGLSLSMEKNRYVCPKNHSFDLASSGYVNLLLSEKSSRKAHGDNKEMIRARHAFLESGYYELLRETLCKKMQELLPVHACLLDAGCGEGYYTQKMREYMPESDLYGIDISKEALKLAGKRKLFLNLATASVYKLPFGEKSMDAVISVFSPFSKQEFFRVLKENGKIFQVIPTARHLWELKSAIYEQPYENQVAPYEIECFDFLEKISIQSRILLTKREDIENLFQMTPYFYRTSVEDHEKIRSLSCLETEIGFEILIYQKSSNSTKILN
jgi:23S rRNA (guanine745-N1)-methyltransferase